MPNGKWTERTSEAWLWRLSQSGIDSFLRLINIEVIQDRYNVSCFMSCYPEGWGGEKTGLCKGSGAGAELEGT